MFYRENGQFKSTYRADVGLFPIAQDRWFMAALALVAFVAIPALASDYLFRAVLIPFLILATLFSYFALSRRKWQQGEDNE